MAIDRTHFFDRVRQHPFDGNIAHQSQVDGLNAILDEWERRKPPGADLRWLAYMLATADHETAATMQPVREAFWLSENWRRLHLAYYPYYGRGYVQLTWDYNYRRQSQPDRVGIDLVSNPDKALEPAIAAAVMFVGMENGDFIPPHKLADYFNGTTEDPVNARRIINGLDRADLIAALYGNFKAALT